MDIQTVEIRAGRLCIGHRPGKSSFRSLRDAGVTHVVTLLGPTEGAEPLMSRLEAQGFETLWLPLASAKPIEDRLQIAEIVSFYDQLADLLGQGHTLFVHCSAGIHRTGMIVYGLLRYLEFSSNQARSCWARCDP